MVVSNWSEHDIHSLISHAMEGTQFHCPSQRNSSIVGMLNAKSLSIVWGSDSRYWKSTTLDIGGQSTEVAELINVCWLHIDGIYEVSIGETIEVQRGATLFNRACIACHVGGGNIIQPGATLFLKDLQRNGVDTEDEIYSVTYFGKGRMPGFGENCKPRGQCTFGARLQEDEIRLLAEFVKSQAAQGWPNIEISGD